MPEEIKVDMSELKRFNPTPTFSSSNTASTQVSYTVQVVIPPPDDTIEIAYSVKRRYICFDQAMANTGWVVIETSLAGLEILMMNTIRTQARDELMGWADTLDRAAEVYLAIHALLSEWEVDTVVHELPPIGNGPFMRRTDSSIVAATAVRCAAINWQLPVEMVSAQTAKKFFTGDRNAKKGLVRDELKRRYGHMMKDSSFQLNEHTYDALALGAYLIESEHGTK